MEPHAAGLGPQNHLELSAQLCCAHLAWLPGAAYAALSLPLLSRMGEKHGSAIPESWHKGALFFPCLKPHDNKWCVVMAMDQMQGFVVVVVVFPSDFGAAIERSVPLTLKYYMKLHLTHDTCD